MQHRLFTLFVFTLYFAAASVGQDTLVLNGNYFGKNLYVINPGQDTGFCVQKVLVNNQLSKDEIRSNSFELDFSLLNIQQNAPLKVYIISKKGCKVKVVNPDAIQPQSTFGFVSAKPDKTGKLVWVVKGEVFSSFIIEQYKWQKWVTVGEVGMTDTVKNNVYIFEIKPTFGPNLFRISHTDIKGNTVYSKQIKYRSLTVKEVFLSSTKVEDNIVFSGETAYEIFDEKGNFISDGIALQVSVSDLPKGKYWVNYDNKTELITKK